MSKIDLDPITSGYNLSKINANFQKVEDELNNKVLYRDSPAGEPNNMSSNLDMNGQSILNASKISSNVLEIGGVQVVPTNLAIDPYNGTREALRRGYAEAGYDLVGRFSDTGLTVPTISSVVLWEPTGVAYAYSGTLPHMIGAAETPIGNPLWVAKADESLRGELVAPSGSSSVGFQQEGTGAVPRTAEDKMRETVSVKDFGAKGDGITDDSVSIQAAITYLEGLAVLSAEGKKLYFPAGFYKLSAALVINDMIVLEGEGAESTKIQTTTGRIFEVNCSGVEIRGIFFVGPSGVSGNGIRFTNGNNCVVERCVFQNQITGIELITSYAVEIIGCIFDVCFNYGIYANTTCHNLIVENSGFFTCGVRDLGHAISLNAGSDNLNIINNDFEHCNVNIRLNACNSVQITGNYMEYHKSECFEFIGVNTGIIVESNWIALGGSASGGDTLTIQNITGGSFRHNTIYNQSVNFAPDSLIGFTVGLNKKSGSGTYSPETAWASPTLQNSWGQQTNYTVVGYTKDENGWVHLRGGVLGGVVPNPIFTLPAGYRPAKIATFSTVSASGSCNITVNPNGTVVPSVAAGNNPCLDGIRFWVG